MHACPDARSGPGTVRPMTTSLLLVAIDPNWFGTIRVPRALTQAGFEVTLLAPPGALVDRTRYLARKINLPYPLTPLQWAYAFDEAVRATAPRIVLACDEQSFILL